MYLPQKTNFLTVSTHVNFTDDELKHLLDIIGIEKHTPKYILYQACVKANHIVCIRVDDELIAVARSMDDNCWNANIDFIAIHPAHDNEDIQNLLMTTMLTQLNCVKNIHVTATIGSNMPLLCRKLGIPSVKSHNSIKLVQNFG